MDLSFNGHAVRLSPRAYGDIEYKQRINWKAKSRIQRERANLMFDRLQQALFSIANTTDFSIFEKSPKGTYQYIVTDRFAVIIFELIKVNDSLVIYVTDFLWPYKKDPNSWWKIVESNDTKIIRITETQFMGIITECITNYLKENVLKEEFDYEKTSYNNSSLKI